jgi:leucyl-tRNA synthetase
MSGDIAGSRFHTQINAAYLPQELEGKWQRIWQERQVFKAVEDKTKQKYYVLEMFPYPSGHLHMGHLRNYAIGDVIARFKKLQGYNVLHPMGWDAFGLPAENAAIANKIHPKEWTEANIAAMREELGPIGISYDWEREIATCAPDYYKHEQAMFLDFLAAGLAYQKESVVNWDPVDGTVLANEQVVDGKGWRSGVPVERKKLTQWFLKITHFADELLNELDNLEEWPEKVRVMQRNWIGKSSGALVQFSIKGSNEAIEIYTTRPDTLFGASFLALAPNHPVIEKLAAANPALQSFVKSCEHDGLTEDAIETAEKKGFDTGIKAVHPFDETIEIPVYAANFVLLEYGTGAIFGCPAHDERDNAFAHKYKLPIKQVVALPEGGSLNIDKEAYTGEGVIVNSNFLDRLTTAAAKEAAIKKLEELQKGSRKINYRLRDWGVSRQRYWGCPIPIIHCETCGVVPVPKKDLPVELPEDVVFEGTGNPLDKHPTWKHVKCPECGKDARRETDTFDTFFESSWYFARFCSPQAEGGIDKAAADYWLPVDQYIGGIEHAVLHLLYARFFVKALKQCGYLSVDEPFKRLLTQGMICHETYKTLDGKWLHPKEVIAKKDGFYHSETGEKVECGRIEKMSKSKKNVVEPEGIINKYGADTARLFLLSDSPPERDLEWTDSGVEGAYKYLSRFYNLVIAYETANGGTGEADKEALMRIHQTIKTATEDIASFHFNKAIARIRELTNYLTQNVDSISSKVFKDGLKVLVKLLNPFTPHITEELWQHLEGGEFLALNEWPVADESLIVEENKVVAIQVNGKMRGTVNLPIDAEEAMARSTALALPNLAMHIAGKEIVKVIYVPNKIVNIVVK